MNMDNDLQLLQSRMSRRLIANAELLGRDFECTADVGCDHGYVSMYLVMTGISKRAIAMDVRKGPLSAAGSNVGEFGLSDRVTTRLSDGLSELRPGEADSLVIAGMGGKLMISILDREDLRALGIKRGVLQPQSEIPQFREYLRRKGYSICDEQVIFEDGKYYFPMLVDFEPSGNLWAEAVDRFDSKIREATGSSEDRETVVRLADCFGVFNILRRERALLSYLEHGAEVDESILQHLDEREHEGRYREVRNELSDIELLLKLFK